MNPEPIEVIRFQKTVDGTVEECNIEQFEDGSVGVFPKDKDADILMFEFTDDALKRAIEEVTEQGYVQVS